MPSDALVLFDIDGTLMRGAGPHHKEALLNGIHSVTGVACSFDGIDTSGQLDRDLIAALLRSANWRQRRTARELPSIMRASQACYQRDCMLDLRAKVLPGVLDALSDLRRRCIPMGLVTGNLTAIAWRKLELAGLREFFLFGAFAEEGRTRARLAQVAAWRAKRLGLVARGCRVSLIGDHANDVTAAKANGFRSVAVATGFMRREELGLLEPDLLLDDMRQLPVALLTGGHGALISVDA